MKKFIQLFIVLSLMCGGALAAEKQTTNKNIKKSTVKEVAKNKKTKSKKVKNINNVSSVSEQPIKNININNQEQVLSEDSEFKSCLKKIKPEAISSGVKEETFSQYTKDLEANTKLLTNLNDQPEFKFPFLKYLAALVSVDRITKGKELLKEHKDLLVKIEEQYGVPANVVVAVWGVESNYGKNFGKHSLVQSLGTLSCYGRRQEFFKKEWFSALRILQEGHFKQAEFKGSWAGAFGHTQFMPTTFEKIAVDFDGDGKKDLINNIPDALASTANFLKNAGWKRDHNWGFEVVVPKDFTFENEGRKVKRELSYWKEKGIKLSSGQDLPSGLLKYGLLKMENAVDSVYLVNSNFDAIYRYNAAESYAVAIAKLSEIIKSID